MSPRAVPSEWSGRTARAGEKLAGRLGAGLALRPSVTEAVMCTVLASRYAAAIARVTIACASPTIASK